MQFPSDEHESFISIPHTFSASRVYVEDEHSRISAAEITINIACGPVDNDKMPLEERGKRAVIGFQRLKVWLDAILNDVMLVDVNSELLETLVDGVVNYVMFIPGQPDDSMLAVLLHSKVFAITKGLLDIHSISLSASDTEGVVRYYRNLSKTYPLPGIEYLDSSEKPKHDTPWWGRPTLDICEFVEDDEENEIIRTEFDPLSEIGKEYLTNGEEADIIVFDIWKNRDK